MKHPVASPRSRPPRRAVRCRARPVATRVAAAGGGCRRVSRRRGVDTADHQTDDRRHGEQTEQREAHRQQIPRRGLDPEGPYPPLLSSRAKGDDGEHDDADDHCDPDPSGVDPSRRERQRTRRRRPTIPATSTIATSRAARPTPPIAPTRHSQIRRRPEPGDHRPREQPADDAAAAIVPARRGATWRPIRGGGSPAAPRATAVRDDDPGRAALLAATSTIVPATTPVSVTGARLRSTSSARTSARCDDPLEFVALEADLGAAGTTTSTLRWPRRTPFATPPRR